MRTTIIQLCLLVCTIAAVHGYRYKYNCACGRNFRIICDNNHDEHSNQCLFECAQRQAASEGRSIHIVRYGNCPAKPRPCICRPLNYPVCGSDGKTYANPCELQCASGKSQNGIFLKNEGACPEAPKKKPSFFDWLPWQH